MKDDQTDNFIIVDEEENVDEEKSEGAGNIQVAIGIFLGFVSYLVYSDFDLNFLSMLKIWVLLFIPFLFILPMFSNLLGRLYLAFIIMIVLNVTNPLSSVPDFHEFYQDKHSKEISYSQNKKIYYKNYSLFSVYKHELEIDKKIIENKYIAILGVSFEIGLLKPVKLIMNSLEGLGGDFAKPVNVFEGAGS